MSHNPLSHSPLTFTLGETASAAPAKKTSSQPADGEADWERSLQHLQQSKQRNTPLLMDDVFAAPAPPETASRRTTAVPARQQAPIGAAKSTPLLDPAQREQAYRAYLQQWQHQHALEQERQHTALNDTAVLLQEDWLAAQECLQRAPEEGQAACIIRLNARQEAEVLPPALEHPEAGEPANEEAVAEAATPTEVVTHVHLHVLEPRGAQGRLLSCVSETELLARLSEKLRPHLADAMAGMVRMAVQKQTVQLVSRLQQQLLAEIPATVDDVLQHNLSRIMRQIKQEQWH